jgi:SAM-dependent methyltransferase
MENPVFVLTRLVEGLAARRYPGWNADSALRYLPMADHLRRFGIRSALDVGSGGRGLSVYWEGRVVEMDLVASGWDPRPNRLAVAGSGLALPFRAKSFDAAVCSDVIEHLGPEDRLRLASEMIRVARRKVILGAPCGRAAREAEIAVDRVHRLSRGCSHPWLEEHLLHPIPDEKSLAEEIRRIGLAQGVRAIVHVQGNTNLLLWKTVFTLYVGGGPRRAAWVRSVVLLLLPVLRHLHGRETYRKIFFVDLMEEACLR